MDRSFRILLLEDNEWDAKVVQEALEGNDETRGFLIVRARSLAEAEREIDAGPFDVILSDLNVGDSRGLDTTRRLMTRTAGRSPLVVLTGSLGDQMGVAAVKEGAVDFVKKDQLDGRRLALSVRFAVERHANLTLAATLERKRYETEFRNSWTSAVAHELNTPITPLTIQLHLVKSGALGQVTDKQRQCIAVLDRNINRLQGLVGDFLDMAKIDAGKLQLRPAPCDLTQLARDVCETYGPLADSSGVDVTFNPSGSAPVTADATRLTQVMFNLVSNALKYTPRGGKLVVSCGPDAEGAFLRVADTGPGLTADQISRLFTPFGQVHSAAGGQKVGTGVGLFISKGLIEAHGGTIWCESEGPQRGSTFGFWVPAAPAASKERVPIIATT